MSELFPLCGRHPLIADPQINLTYDDILAMSDAEFLAYVERMRTAMLRVWDENGNPPSTGWSADDVEDDFAKLLSFPVHEKLWRTDQLTGMRCIHNMQTVGNAVNAFNMGRMLKVRINYTEKDDGRSIYDFFARPDLFKRYVPYARRHFLRDSFYFFAQSVKVGDPLPERAWIRATTGEQYVRDFAEHTRPYGTHEILLEAKKRDSEYSGYAEHLRSARFLALTFKELVALSNEHVLPRIALRVIKKSEYNDQHVFHVRLYRRGERLFPALFKSFKISMCQYAVNFPPLTAKLIYEEFLRRIPNGDVTVWDPSGGWAGRILAAMSVELRNEDNTHRSLTYLGTDPNPDFYQNGSSVYGAVADTYNAVRQRGSLFDDTHTYRVWQCGSEDIRHHPDFAAYRGQLDFVFTSPPYFNREAYCEDDRQSFKKFGSSYESWRDGFLRETLRTAYDWLRPNRYLVWNIADIKVGKKYIPLQHDSVAIAKALGFEYVETIAMTLRGMPGANRTDADGKLTARNTVKIDGVLYKYEPMFVFRKP